MNYLERKDLILSLLNSKQYLSFKDLEEYLSASPATIRRDLSKMEKDGVIERFHGGVKRIDSIFEESMIKKEKINEKGKQYIAKIAVSFIKSDSIVFIGSGSTTFQMIKYMDDTSVVIITNGIPHGEALRKKGFRVFMLGGYIKGESRALVGDETVRMIESFDYDYSFFSSNGINNENYLLSADENEYNIKEAAIKNSKKCFALMDATKYGKSAIYKTDTNREDLTIISENDYI